MAFLDFSQPMAGPAPVASIAQGVSTPTDFTQQEWQIVALARTDGLRSLHGPGRFVRLRRWIFGEDTNLTLLASRLCRIAFRLGRLSRRGLFHRAA